MYSRQDNLYPESQPNDIFSNYFALFLLLIIFSLIKAKMINFYLKVLP